LQIAQHSSVWNHSKGISTFCWLRIRGAQLCVACTGTGCPGKRWHHRPWRYL